MKIRKGFVSNSSSSSFVCDICGEVYEGWDASPLDSDFECSICPHEHIICNEHIKVDTDAFIEEDEYNLSSASCPICQFENYSENDMAKYLEKTRKVSRADVFAKVKAINKRRKKLHNSEYITSICEQFSLNDDILLKEIKEKFGVYEKMIAFINK